MVYEGLLSEISFWKMPGVHMASSGEAEKPMWPTAISFCPNKISSGHNGSTRGVS